MTNRNILMLSHAFVPAARAGVFRTLRFVRYLPRSGWRPLVVMRAPAPDLGGADPSLERLLPPETVVVQTGTFSFYAGACRRAKTLFRKQDASPPAAAANSPSNSQDVAAEDRACWLRRAIRAANHPIEQWTSIPDQHIGWILPAVKAGLALNRQYRPRVIYSTGPPHSSHLAAILLKRFTGLPVVLDLRDPWGRTEWNETGGVSARERLQCRLERFCVRRADRVILNTPRLRDEFERFYGQASAGKFTAITNGYDPDVLPEIEAITAETGPRDACSDRKTIRICHPGTVYGRRSLKPLLAAAAIAVKAGHDVTVEQVGQVADAADLLGYVRELNMESHVRLMDRLPHREILRRMAAVDILAVIQPETGIQVPGKLYEMLPFRKPLIALTEEGATADIVEQFRLGKVAPSGNTDAIAAAIIELLDDLGNYPETAGWECAMDTFDGRRLTQALGDMLDELCAAPSTSKRSVQ